MSDDVLTHIPALRLFARSLTGRYGEADDLVQDTLVRAISSAGSYTPGTNMRAWLFTIMRNRFYNDRVKRARERPGAEDCVSGQPSSPDGAKPLGVLSGGATMRTEAICVVLIPPTSVAVATMVYVASGTTTPRPSVPPHVTRAAREASRVRDS